MMSNSSSMSSPPPSMMIANSTVSTLRQVMDSTIDRRSGSPWKTIKGLINAPNSNNNNLGSSSLEHYQSSPTSLMLPSPPLLINKDQHDLDEENDIMSIYSDGGQRPISSQTATDHLRSMLLMAAMGAHHPISVPVSIPAGASTTAPSLPLTPPPPVVGFSDLDQKFPLSGPMGSPTGSRHPYNPILMMKMMMGNVSFLDHFSPVQTQMPPPASNGSIVTPPPTIVATTKTELLTKQQSPSPPDESSMTKTKLKSNKCHQRISNRNQKGPTKQDPQFYSSNRRLVPSTVSTPLSPLDQSSKNPLQVGNSPISESHRIENPIYRCHLCPYTGNSKLHFNAHMNTHFDHRCPHCDYTSRTEGRLKRHIRDFHSETPPDTWTGTGRLIDESNFLEGAELILDGDGSGGGMEMSAGGTGPNPARNRKYRCKQCGYVAMDKHDFWEHSKDHIKSDKMLACPRCNFVTEYKHHLEYHLRNHFGSKPFKCAKCNYSCVNKSMLNSHMKSHSNIYQYRCDDCTYATKYCHSLKLHLRKYKHRPATVLNLDGTPNPYPVIDVYGTRRGPRPKKQQPLTTNVGTSSTMQTKSTTKSKSFSKKESTQKTQNLHSTITTGQESDSEIALPQPLVLEQDKSNSNGTNSDHMMKDSSLSLSNKPIKNIKPVGPKSINNNEQQLTGSNNQPQNTIPTVTYLKCNYCPFQTESKPDFSNHLLNHVMNEKLSLLNDKRKQQQQQIVVKNNKPEAGNLEVRDTNEEAEKLLVPRELEQNKFVVSSTKPLDLTKLISEDHQEQDQSDNLLGTESEHPIQHSHMQNPLSTLLQNLLQHQQQRQLVQERTVNHHTEAATTKTTTTTTTTTTGFVHKKRKGQARKLLLTRTHVHDSELKQLQNNIVNHPSFLMLNSSHTPPPKKEDKYALEDIVDEKMMGGETVIEDYVADDDDDEIVMDYHDDEENEMNLNQKMPEIDSEMLPTSTNAINEDVGLIDLYQQQTNPQHRFPPIPIKSPIGQTEQSSSLNDDEEFDVDDGDDSESDEILKMRCCAKKNCFHQQTADLNESHSTKTTTTETSSYPSSMTSPNLVSYHQNPNPNPNPNLLQMFMQMLSSSCSSSSSSSIESLPTIVSGGSSPPPQPPAPSSSLSSSTSLSPLSSANLTTAYLNNNHISLNNISSATASSLSPLLMPTAMMNNNNNNFIINNLNNATAVAAALAAASTTTTATNITSSSSSPPPPSSLSVEQMDNVNNLINKMHSITFLMQEILLEMWSIKK